MIYSIEFILLMGYKKNNNKLWPSFIQIRWYARAAHRTKKPSKVWWRFKPVKMDYINDFRTRRNERILKVFLFIISVIYLFLSGLTVCRAETAYAGLVKTVGRSAFVVRNGDSLEAVPGMRIQKGDIVRTGDKGSIGLIFTDDTIISMGSKSEITIEDYLFDPVKGKLSFVARMIQGTISFISGQITKLSPSSVRLETPAATIGVRGTHFLVKIEG
jgi:hypothetical protein